MPLLIVEHLNEIEGNLRVAQTHVRELRELLSAPRTTFSENATATALTVKATPYLSAEFWNEVLSNAI